VLRPPSRACCQQSLQSPNVAEHAYVANHRAPHEAPITRRRMSQTRLAHPRDADGCCVSRWDVTCAPVVGRGARPRVVAESLWAFWIWRGGAATSLEMRSASQRAGPKVLGCGEESRAVARRARGQASFPYKARGSRWGYAVCRSRHIASSFLRALCRFCLLQALQVAFPSLLSVLLLCG
jgi:hypothetical protein